MNRFVLLKYMMLLSITGFNFYPASAQQKLLWQIGSQPGDVNKFSLAPGNYKNYAKDGFFIVGKSVEKNDWPYCHPGPNDAWAGNREHTFAIVFGLKEIVAQNNCLLKFELADVGNSDISLSVNVNGNAHAIKIPEGDAKGISGDVAGVEKKSFEILIPANELIAGNNIIALTSKTGSWFIYNNITFLAPEKTSIQPVAPNMSLGNVEALPYVLKKNNNLYRQVNISLTNIGNATDASFKTGNNAAQNIHVESGLQQALVLVPEVTKDSAISITLLSGNKTIATKNITISPAAKMTIYVLNHSHTDIGYTEIQSAVEARQINNLLKGMEYAKRTKDYPDGAKFIWNIEGTYIADLFLQRMNEEQKKDFFDAVKDGSVALNGMYLNTLTGLCKPEELLNLFKYTTELGKKCNVPVDAAMISDVPGYTWGTVEAMHNAGIKYFSVAPNNFDRIGDILVKWEDKPFYWMSPSGNEKVLVWIPYRGYALSHGVPHLNADFVASYLNKLKEINYPYDITHIRWSGHGDNAVPEIEVSDFVKDWNNAYEWPKFIISSTGTAFKAFENKYGNMLPVEKGDWTGYWEDGAGSSAFETAQNRASSERLSQANTLWVINNKKQYPYEDFMNAWRHVLLYSEHTWGADESVTTPLSQKTKEQWEIKKSYATTANDLSVQLIKTALSNEEEQPVKDAVDVYNTNSWAKTGLALIPGSANNNVVRDSKGNIIPSQRLSTGELAFVAKDIAPFSAKRFFISTSKKTSQGLKDVFVNENVIDNGIIRIVADKKSGAIASIRNVSINNNFADSTSGNYLNDYLFLLGKNIDEIKRNGPVIITVKEKGPVLSVLKIESEAPGCNKLTREIRLVAGLDYVEVTNILDKKPAELNPTPGNYAWANTGGKESLNFGFPFNVPKGVMNIDIPFAVMQPEKDQIPGSCKNWLVTNNWVDVSNNKIGITWSSLDAPLIEVGGITANLLGGQTNPAVWRKQIEPTQKLYSWALNNHWETNYRAYQDGIITFRYAMQPHEQYNAVTASEFAATLSQPLVVANAKGNEKAVSFLQLSSKNVMVKSLKPSDDGKEIIITLFNPTNQKQQTALQFSSPVKNIYYSNTAEEKLSKANSIIEVAPLDMATLKIER